MGKKADKKADRKLREARPDAAPVVHAPASVVDVPPPAREGGVQLDVKKLAAQLTGAKLSYGEPIRAGERVLIPVARVSAAGGGGWGLGRGKDDDGGEGQGWGGGGTLESAPVGFIEVGPEGARFEAIPDPIGTAKAVRTGAAAIAALVGGLVAFRRRGVSRRPLLRR